MPPPDDAPPSSLPTTRPLVFELQAAASTATIARPWTFDSGFLLLIGSILPGGAHAPGHRNRHRSARKPKAVIVTSSHEARLKVQHAT
jgi:hypothetical protein